MIQNNSLIDFVIFFPLLLTILLVIVFTITSIQQKKSKQILEKLTGENLEHVTVNFVQNQTSGLNAVGGVTIKAEMYFNKDFILVCPRHKNLFNGMFNFNLPIILAKDLEKIIKLTDFNNVTKPDEFKLTESDILLIKYHKSRIINIKYDIEIELLDCLDFDKISMIKQMTF